MSDAIATFNKRRATGRRIFIGCGERQVRAAIAGLDTMVRPTPSVTTVDDALLVPVERYMKGYFRGGVYAGEHYLAEGALHRGAGAARRPHVEPPSVVPPPERSFGTAIFGGYLFDHYGHFLLEGLSRMLDERVRETDLPILVFNPTRIERLKPYMAKIFAHAGIDPERIILCNVPTRINELLMQEPTFEIRGLVRPSAYDSLRRGGARRGAGQTIYLTRTGLGPRQRVQVEARLEEALRATGLATILSPETLSWEDQIACLADADLIIACEGSALHTLILTGVPTRFLCLSDGMPNVNYLLCDEIIDGDAVYLNAAVPRTDEDGRNWTIDTDTVLDWVERTHSMA